MRSGFGLAAMLAALALSACTQDELVDRFTNPADRAAATRYIDALRMRDFAPIQRDLDPSIRPSATPALMEQMAGLFPPGSPTRIRQIGAFTNVSGDGKHVNLTFEYDYGDRWVIVNVATKSAGGSTTITGLNVVPRTVSLEAENRFSLQGKEAKHYAILAGAIAVPIFIVSCLILCFRTPIKSRKWAWFLGIALGVGTVGINWATGEVHVQPLYFLLLGGAATAAPYGPWTISFALPVGAVLFLFRRRRLAAVAQPLDPA